MPRLSNRNSAVLCDFSHGLNEVVLARATLDELVEAYTWINDSKSTWIPWRAAEGETRLNKIQDRIDELQSAVDPLVDLNVKIDDILLGESTIPEIKKAIALLLSESKEELASKNYKEACYKRADLLQRIVNQLVPSCAAIKLGDPEIGTIKVNGVWVVPTERQNENEHVGYLIKGKLVYCTKCALLHSLTKPAAIALYPVNILPYSQQCRQCQEVLVSGLRQSDGSGCYLNLI